MPMFFIISGFLYIPNFDIRRKVVNDVRRLLVPYIFTCLIWMICILFLFDNSYHSFIFTLKAIFFASGANHLSIVFPNAPKIGAIWFLFALFWCRNIYNYIIIENYAHSYFIILSIAIISTCIDYYLINLPFGLLPGLSAMTFYLIGNYIRNHIITTIQLCICGICWVIHLLFFNLSMCTCEYGFYPIDVFGAVFGTIVVWQFSKILSKYKFSFYITRLGQASLVVLCCHTLEKNLLDLNSVMQGSHWIAIFIIESIICILLTIIWYKIYRILALTFFS